MSKAKMAKETTTRLPEETFIRNLLRLQQKLLHASDLAERVAILKAEPSVVDYLENNPTIQRYCQKAAAEDVCIVTSIIAIGQGPSVLSLPQAEKEREHRDLIQRMVESLRPAEIFYGTIGGLVGYHLTVLRLLCGEDLGPFADDDTIQYAHPELIDIRSLSPSIWEAIRHAIKSLPSVAEIYVVGGAGDRLDLRDPTSGEPLPAARLKFQGRTLLEGLMRDLQAREYLYYKLFHEQLRTPIALMTSEEKNNHNHIIDICQEHDWFGRPRSAFLFFSQPGGPVVSANGDWSLKAPLTPTLKPGGHGVLWKLASDSGVFDWLKAKQCSKLLVRQINNPVAGTDYGLLAFLGCALQGNKAFGMASCDRLLNRPEGMSVLIETHTDRDYVYRISNIEYTEFKKSGIQDLPKSPDSEVSLYPSNTNILFADLDVIQTAITKCPLPGLLINMKTVAPFLNADGSITEMPAGRLETTMQNIADYIVDLFKSPLRSTEQSRLRTFATYNERRKTLSATKNSLTQGCSVVGTPEGSLYDVLSNYQELFQNECQWTLPSLEAREVSATKPPPFLIQLHPAIGPIFALIGQKIRGGSLQAGSELRLELSEIDIEELHIDGSCRILADCVIGHPDSDGIITYSERTGKCTLHRVRIRNKGINRDSSGPYWRDDLCYNESFTLVLHGNAEFYAEDIEFEGDQEIEVADGQRMVAKKGPNNCVIFEKTAITQPTWHWRYAHLADGSIKLTKDSI